MLKERMKAFFSWVPGIEPPVEPANEQLQQSRPTSGGGNKGASTAEPELQNIKGIGPGIAKKLVALGIRTYPDLAAADPERLAKQLGTRPVTPQKVRGWIAEAKKRA